MNKIKKCVYNLAREYVKKQLTGNLGKVVEKEDRLICYVNKTKSKNFYYEIFCSGILDKDYKIAETYKLNKSIYYVFDQLEFKKNKVHIYGFNDCNISIKNCTFNYGLNISGQCNCALENSVIKPFERLILGAVNLTIKNMSIDNYLKYTRELEVLIGAFNQLEIIDSKIGKEREKTNVTIVSENATTIDNSKVAGNQVKIESNVIKMHHDSSLIASDKVTLKTNNFEPIKITSPMIILNDKEINYNNKIVLLRQLTNPLSIKRLELIELLKQVKEKCDKNNLEDRLKYEVELNNRLISKTLKK